MYLLPGKADKLDMYSCSGWQDSGEQTNTISFTFLGRENGNVIYISIIKCNNYFVFCNNM